MRRLADRYGKEPVQLGEIAKAQRIPANSLTTIHSELGRSGVMESQRGRDGGYWLATLPEALTYGDLVKMMRGSIARVPCASRNAHERCSNCLAEDECRLRALMLKVRDQTAELLDAIRLSDVIQPLPSFDELLPEHSSGA